MSGGCCQGFLVWPPGCGSWCCYEQTQKINLLIQRHYWLDTHSHSQSLLLSLYLLLTFGEWKSQKFSLVQFSLQLRVAIRYIFGWDLRKCLLTVLKTFSLLKRGRKAEALASCLWTWLHEEVMSGSGAAILQIWGKKTKYKNKVMGPKEEKPWHNWATWPTLRAAHLWTCLFI